MSSAPEPRQFPGWLLGGIATGILLAALLVGFLTQTTPGHKRVLELTLQALGGQVNGRLTIDRVTGNLLTGARLYNLGLYEEDGTPLLLADSARIEYQLPALVGGDVVLDYLVLYDAELYVYREPGDTAWNYQRVFPPSENTGPGRATVIQRGRLVNTSVVVRSEWEPDEQLTGAARERAIAEAVADTSRLVVDRVPGGVVRTMRFRLDEVLLSRAVIAPEERGGRYFAIDSLAGTAWIWRDPLRIRALEGQLALRNDRVEFQAAPVLLPSSRLAARGVVDLSGEEMRFDITVLGERLALSDLQWLYPQFPQQGQVELRLTLETRPEGTLYLARDMRFESPGALIVGDLGMIVGDTIRFLNTALEAPVLDIPAVEAMLPTELPVEGLRIGRMEISTPRS
jgi:hypothetical protein